MLLRAARVCSSFRIFARSANVVGARKSNLVRVRGVRVRIIIDIYEGEIGGWTRVLSTVFLST